MAMVPRWLDALGRKAGRSELLAAILAVSAVTGHGQILMPGSAPGGSVRLFSTDAAILEAGETRKDLPCTVNTVKPFLGFDLKFHGGYDVSVPLKELAGTDNHLTMVFRVYPEKKPDEAAYFSQHWNVPAIDEDAGGAAQLSGTFDVGEGKYHVDWLMRDRAERVCSFSWDTEATLPPKDRQIALDIQPGLVKAVDTELFKQEPPVERIPTENLNVKVVVNFAPQDSLSATLQPVDTHALLSILRNVARDPHIGRFSIVAFNMQEQRVIYRQEAASQIDFPALGEALRSLNLGTVDVKRLGQKHGDTEFLTNFLTAEVVEPKDQPDAVIIAGPKVTTEGSLPQDAFRQAGDLKYPVFYMNYNLNPTVNPWRDAIGAAVKSLKGSEFTITRPRDLFFAWTDIIGRIVKSKLGRPAAANGAAAQ